MAVTATFSAFDQIKGPYRGAPANAPLHLCRFTLTLTGSYSTGGFVVDTTVPFVPTGATGTLYQGQRSGLASTATTAAFAFGDYTDATGLTATINNASIVLSSGGAATSMSAASTGNLVTLKLFTGVNGIGGVELTNGQVLNGAVGLFAAMTTAMPYLGNV